MDHQLFAEQDEEQQVRSENSPAHWRRDLTDKVRVLLHAKPLFDLRRSDSLRAEELRHYDTLALAIKVWDLIVENMGLDVEINRSSLRSALEPLLRKMDHAAGIEPDSARHDVAVEQVVGALANDGERRRPFSVAYQDFAEGDAVQRKLEYRLIWDYLHPSGGTVLRLSNEAVNLYLRAWDLDIEDAQAAAEAVVLSQLNRGKFDEAVSSARNARLQSLRYWDKFLRIMRDTRRDVHRVDWTNEVPKLLDEALLHITSRTDMEASILKTARERLDMLEDDNGARAVAEVCRLVEDCRKRHFALHGQLMTARNVFLDEQDRQAFHVAIAIGLPSLVNHVLEPLLSLPKHEASHILRDAAAPLIGPIPPQMLSLAELIVWMLRPRREAATEEMPLEPADLVNMTDELLRFPEEIRQQGDSLLDDIEQSTTLSELLSAVSDWDGPAELQEYLVLSALQQFAPESGENSQLVVQKALNEILQAEGFSGDELVLSRWEASHE